MMPNQWFRFKQFIIHQEQCAMKVGTDGVILGAWTDTMIGNKVLDVGTGTGLLSLMLAQREASLQIDAIEIDPEAAQQAKENVMNSPYSNRIRVIHADFREYEPDPDPLYDLIICNPPYFSNSFKAQGKERNLARHSDTLELHQLFKRSARLLHEQGIVSLIIPSEQESKCIEIAADSDFYPRRILEVLPVPNAPPGRHCIEFSRYTNDILSREFMVIEEKGRHKYSNAYRELTKDFYLDL